MIIGGPSLTKYNDRTLKDLTTAPASASSSPGALVHIKTLTASSSSTLSFVHGSSDVVLDSTYPIYKFEFTNMHPATDQQSFEFNTSTDSGSNYNTTKTTTFFYAYNRGSDSATNFQYDSNRDLAQSTDFQKLTFNSNIDNYSSASGSLTLFNPSSTTFVKHFMSVTNDDAQTSGEQGLSQVCYTAGYMNTTNAINAIQFKYSSGNIDAGTIKLYGIKDS